MEKINDPKISTPTPRLPDLSKSRLLTVQPHRVGVRIHYRLRISLRYRPPSRFSLFTPISTSLASPSPPSLETPLTQTTKQENIWLHGRDEPPKAHEKYAQTRAYKHKETQKNNRCVLSGWGLIIPLASKDERIKASILRANGKVPVPSYTYK